MKGLILKEVEKIKYKLWEINDYIYNNPEIGNEEFKAVKELADFLRENNFVVELGILDKPTSFKATYKSDRKGPNIAYLCEYDALPEIGHGCGHNMIGTMGVGAAVALSKVLDSIGGQITVLGTPAEECDGAKVEMTEKGVFDDVDVAMILHPSDVTYESGKSLAMDAIQFYFKGKASHAAAEPEAAINALDAIILTFNGINALRQHIPSDTRIHGIIKEGGVAANIVPDKSIAQFYVRASTREALNKVVEKVKNIAKGASLMTGAELEISNYEISYDNMKTNITLSKVFNNNLKYVGVKDILPAKESYGSVDMGNVSNVVPAIHPYIGIGCFNTAAHTKGFAEATVTDAAHEALVQGASALALTGYEVIKDSELLINIKEEFNTR
ncbi:M20 family metallopeptidase [Clostridium magnum]|uniref:Peptidase M20 domain-containing protein 2 n=1 Tax=Clostridium magnum DSM 2767 TaxID=1121326 RepID=A0A168DW61_9CLOT|nr:M20 family metallopeptidase [Clostridium magnum]KZL91543.1 p-aminobenzoyl-glutamate hydrolase subunit B [Clostridium magnum DSM 2767]SHH46873.1 amidohydrolase [Clostridium magnum DSM 2767]